MLSFFSMVGGYNYGTNLDHVSEILRFAQNDMTSGRPVFAGTRVPVQSLIDHLKAGDRLDDFLDGFPTVRREQAQGFLEMAYAEGLLRFVTSAI